MKLKGVHIDCFFDRGRSEAENGVVDKFRHPPEQIRFREETSSSSFHVNLSVRIFLATLRTFTILIISLFRSDFKQILRVYLCRLEMSFMMISRLAVATAHTIQPPNQEVGWTNWKPVFYFIFKCWIAVLNVFSSTHSSTVLASTVHSRVYSTVTVAQSFTLSLIRSFL